MSESEPQIRLSNEASEEAKDPRFTSRTIILTLVVLLSWALTVAALFYAYQKADDTAVRGTDLASEVNEACNDDVVDTTAVAALCAKATAVIESDGAPEVVRGPKGDKGDTGASGATGARGDTGESCIEAVGLRLCRGPQGKIGVTGMTGQPGDTVTGPTGATGAKGDKGDRGEASTVPGPKGDTGDKGGTGNAGTDGAPGRGIAGLTCNDSGQFVATYTDGTSQVVENSSCTTALINMG